MLSNTLETWLSPINDVSENNLTYYFGDGAGTELDMYFCFQNFTIFVLNLHYC